MKPLLPAFALVAGLVAQAPAPFQVQVAGHGQPHGPYSRTGFFGRGLGNDSRTFQGTLRVSCAHTGRICRCAADSGANAGTDPGRHRTIHPRTAPEEARGRGSHLGGFLALAVASKHPGLAGKLVIVDAYPFFMGAANPQASVEDAKWMAAQIKASLGAMTQDQYERYVKSGVGTREMVTSEAGLVADAMAELYAADLRDDLARIESPALVLGTWIGFRQYTDHARVEANLRAQYAKLRGARIELTDAARHFIMLDDPEWMFKLMDELLASPEKGKKGIPLDAAGLLVSWCGTSAAASSSLINS